MVKKIFKKLVAIEPVSLIPSAEKELGKFAEEVKVYDDVPDGEKEIVRRVGDAEAVLLSYTTHLNKSLLAQFPNVKYIGMCNSLYSPESANVDIRFATEQGIKVTGIRDYGDEGVVEYVISELIRCLHGFGTDANGASVKPWNGIPEEITGLKCGIIGLGKSGGMIADALQFFGADVTYYSRTRKKNKEAEGMQYLPLNDLLAEADVFFCCLNRNTILLRAEEFKILGERKILFNTGLSPAWEENSFKTWIEKDNLCYCDTIDALGNRDLLHHPHVRCMEVSTGRTRQAFDRLSEKVLKNLFDYAGKNYETAM